MQSIHYTFHVPEHSMISRGDDDRYRTCIMFVRIISLLSVAYLLFSSDTKYSRIRAQHEGGPRTPQASEKSALYRDARQITIETAELLARRLHRDLVAPREGYMYNRDNERNARFPERIASLSKDFLNEDTVPHR